MTYARKTVQPLSVVAEPQPGWPAALAALDALLTIAVQRQAGLSGADSLLDPWHGMHMDGAEALRLLAPEAPSPLGDDAGHASEAGVAARLGAAMRGIPGIADMAQRLELDFCDLAIWLLVLAPEIDLRYARLYGYLQDDLTCKRPRYDLIANLLARDAAQRIALRARLSAQAPLLRYAILHMQDEGLACTWQVDDIWRAWLLDESAPELDGAQAEPAAAIGTLDLLPHPPATLRLLRHACDAVLAQGLPLQLLMSGPHGSGKSAATAALAGELGLGVLRLDLREAAYATALRTQIERAARAASLFGAVLMVHGFSKLELRDPQLLRCMADTLAQTACHLVLVSQDGLPPLHAQTLALLRIPLVYPEPMQRQALWQMALNEYATEPDLEAVAARFALSAAQISQAAAEAQLVARAGDRATLGYAELATAARAQCGTELARLAQRITPRADFSMLVTPQEVRDQLRELCQRTATRHTVSRDWGGGSVHTRGIGVKALFVGPSGTGKTLSAEAVARELGLDLFRIDLAGIVSKYIGETEKNLDRVFAAAEYANAVLFFDEADALFGKRSQVKDAHDRYANTEVAYLLQKLEQFDGVAILATNLKQNLDDAFVRRLTFTVNFPFPEEAERRQLWESVWPPRAPRADDVDLDWFAREYRFSGGNIRNTVLAAAHLAAAEGKVITRAHLMHATRREYQKLGKNL